MATTLVQKHLLKGTQEFEIVDDLVNIHIKTPFKQDETLTVMLAVLNTEPVISKSRLEFTSRVNNEALVSLYLAKPNEAEFNAFVTQLKEKIQNEYKAFAGLKTDSKNELEGNIYEEPPEFDEPQVSSIYKKWKPVNIEEVESAIRMMRDYVGGEEIIPLISALEALMSEPENDEIRAKVFTEFESLGPRQGAVLTYAPYIGVLMSGDPYESF